MSRIELPLIVQDVSISEVEALRRLSTALDLVDSNMAASVLCISNSDLSEVRSVMEKLHHAGTDFKRYLKRINLPIETGQQSLFNQPTQCAAV